MADTPRSVTYLQSVFADNTSGNITAQHLRDFLVSALGEHAQLSATMTTTVNLSPTPSKLNIVPMNSVSSGNITASAAEGRITAGTQGVYLVLFTTMLSEHSSDSNVTCSIYKNGADTGFGSWAYVTNSLAGENMTAIGLVSMNQDDYVEIYIYGAGTSTVKVARANFIVVRIK